MRLGQLVLAAVLLMAWTGGSSAFPPPFATQAAVSLKSQNNIEAARWRHRHRGYSWGARGDDTDGGAPSSAGESRSVTSEVVPPDLGRRYRQGRSWGGRRDANRNATGGLALSFDAANRFISPEVIRPDSRRRRGWVDPPPAQ